MKIINLIYVLFILAFAGCQDRDKNGRIVDTATTGYIKIAVDESLKTLVEAEIDTFEGLYRGAHIEALYMSEADAIDALLKDSVRMAIVTRQLLEVEARILEAIKIVPRQLAIAKDGIALIMNRANNDSLVQMKQLKSILEGQITQWKQLNLASKLSNIELVFDNPNSGMVRFLNDSVTNMSKIPPNCFALNSNKAVVDYVSQKTNALGLIGVGWISDHDDSLSNSFLSTIRVAGLARDSVFYQPYQAYLAMGQYPLQRNIYMISREARTGLASGFISFVASDRGQRIILKLGLVPKTMPVRIVEVNHEPFK